MSKETKEAKGTKVADKAKEINKEKLKALQLTLDKLEKTYGKGSIMKMGDKPAENVEVIPTGSLSLDIALGIGGLPKGRVIEIYGPESSGKTTLTLHAIASSATIALVFYPFLEKYDYAGPFVLLFGMVCGGMGTAVFGVVVMLGEVLDRRKRRIAEKLLDASPLTSGDGE